MLSLCDKYILINCRNTTFDIKWISNNYKMARLAADWISNRYKEKLENEQGNPCPMHIDLTCHCKGCCEPVKFTIQEIKIERLHSMLVENYAPILEQDIYYPLGLIFSAHPNKNSSKETIEFWEKTRNYASSLELLTWKERMVPLT